MQYIHDDRNGMGLGIFSVGAMTPVGMNMGQTAGSLITRLQRFRKINSGKVVARCGVDVALSGVPRLYAMARRAVLECRAGIAHCRRLPLLLCATNGRGLADVRGAEDELLPLLCCDADLHIDGENSRVFGSGRAAVGEALNDAHALITSGRAPMGCLVLGVDSLVNALAANTQFLGEAAACVCIGPEYGPQSNSVMARIDGWHVQHITERGPQARVGASEHFVADVIAQGLRHAHGQCHDVHCVVHDSADDRNALRDMALALTQVGWSGPKQSTEALQSLRSSSESSSLALQPWSAAISIGDVGAASGVLLLAYLAFMMQHRHGSVGARALQLGRSDGGLCCAIIVSRVPCKHAHHCQPQHGYSHDQ